MQLLSVCQPVLCLGYEATGRYGACEPNIAADDGVLANCHPAQNRRPRVDHHIILDDWVAWLTLHQPAGAIVAEAFAPSVTCW